MGYTPRGYHFDLKTILSNPDPIIDLRIPIYEESSQSFLNAVNNYKNKSIAAITDKRARDAAELKKLQEKAYKVEVETNKAKVQELELISSKCCLLSFVKLDHYPDRFRTRERAGGAKRS